MPRPLYAKIHLSALKNNFEVARRCAPNSRVLAVIKANGYGHGMLRVARALEAADGFAVLTLDDAIALRTAGFQQMILLLEGFFSADELALLVQYRLTPVIHCREQLETLLHASMSAPLPIFLKANTGMNRLGFKPHEFGAVFDRLHLSANVKDITLMTHFASADEACGVAAQLKVFEATVKTLNSPHSLANSATILRYPEAHGAWTRPGIMLYGASPFIDQSAAELGLQPAMSLCSEIIAIQTIEAGERVGYGGIFRADQPMRVGVVACGYADGYPRHALTGTPINVDGQRTRTLGRVSMDMLYVDITGLPNARIGGSVTLWGVDMPVDEVARAAGTISYELLCARAERVPFVED